MKRDKGEVLLCKYSLFPFYETRQVLLLIFMEIFDGIFSMTH